MTNVQEKIQIILDTLYENLQDVTEKIPSNTDEVIEYLFDNIINN